jgi:hypothetical protein
MRQGQPDSTPTRYDLPETIDQMRSPYRPFNRYKDLHGELLGLAGLALVRTVRTFKPALRLA